MALSTHRPYLIVLSLYFGLFLVLISVSLISLSGRALAQVTSSSKMQVKLPFTVPEDSSRLPKYALIETTKGPVEIMLYRDYAPLSVANFEYLAKNGIYDGVEFHRLVPGFIIQGGDPTGTTKGGPGWTLPPEMNSELQHLRGTIGWARLTAEVNPERLSNGSQFYICLRDAPDLDGFYTVFARVIQGMENVSKLRVTDKIVAIRFPKKPSTARFNKSNVKHPRNKVPSNSDNGFQQTLPQENPQSNQLQPSGFEPF